MSYSFEEYDAFLSSFNNNNANGMPQKELLEDPQLPVLSNPSLSASFSTSDEDLSGVNSNFLDFGAPGNNQRDINDLMLSPYGTNSNPSPSDLNGFRERDNNTNLAVNDQFNINSLDQTLQDSALQMGFQDHQFQPFSMDNNSVKRQSTSSSFSVDSNSYPIKHSDSDSVLSSALNSPDQGHNNQKVKLSNAIPHQGSISKKSCKKEKTSHNAIERRYRTNINDKIKDLRDSVPALRVLVDSGDEDDLDGLQPAKKLNKATILSKATEYIKHLEAKNELLRKENDMLKYKVNEVGLNAQLSGQNMGNFNESRAFPHQSQRGNITNKLLLGGLACMVGSSLSDDFNSADSRSLFSLPVLRYDNLSGFQSLDKPFLALLKISLIVGVLVNLILPMFHYRTEKKTAQADTVSVEDVRNLRKSSVWLSIFTGRSNNEYVKNSIFRAVWLKVNNYNSNFVIKAAVQIYIDHLWSYLQKIKLDSNHNDYDNLKLILSLSKDETINNEEYILKFINVDKLIEEEQQTSTIILLYNMINETITSSTLRKFLIESVSYPTRPISEITVEMLKEIDDHNLELQTLFNPTDTRIDKFQKMLETYDLSKVGADDLLVLCSAIIQNLVFVKKDYKKAKHWFFKIDLRNLQYFNLLGFTSLYMIVMSMTSDRDLYADDQDVIFKIEELSGVLRIWAAKSKGSVLNFKRRSLLIDYFVNVGLTLNGMDTQSAVSVN